MSASSSLTTLQLAEAIARTVLEDAYDSGEGFQWEHAHKRAQAVLETLRFHGCWFCRVTEGSPPAGGIVKSEQMELLW